MRLLEQQSVILPGRSSAFVRAEDALAAERLRYSNVLKLGGLCRVPFEARSMAELRTKVMAGRFKPITPGKYSADLINLMGQLLQVNPQRRPEVSKILASSVVQKHAAGSSHKAAAAEPSSKGNVLQTIKVGIADQPLRVNCYCPLQLDACERC